MYELKPGWRRVKFGDVVKQIKDRVTSLEDSGLTHYLRGEDFLPGEVTLGSRSLIGDGQHGPAFHMKFRVADVLYVSRNPRLQKAAIADFEGICANTTYVCRAKEDALLQELLPFVMQTELFTNFAKRHQRGSTNFYVNWSDLEPFEFNLPPIQEQYRFLAALQAIEKSLVQYKFALKSLNAIGRRILEGFGVDKMDHHQVGELLMEPLVRGWSPICNSQGSGYPTLPSGCVYSGVVDTKNNLKYSELDEETYSRFRLRSNDILVLRGNGNRELVGRAGVVIEDLPRCFFPDLLVRLRFDTSRLDPLVASLIWNSVPIHSKLVSRTKTSNGIYKLGFDDIRDHVIPVPTTSEQNAIKLSTETWSSGLVRMESRQSQTLAIRRTLLELLCGANP